jgi:hypothetical protein
VDVKRVIVQISKGVPVAKRKRSRAKRKPASIKIPSYDASELAFVAYTHHSGHLGDSQAAKVVEGLKSPSARRIGKALLGGPTTDKKVAATVRYLKELSSNRS